MNLVISVWDFVVFKFSCPCPFCVLRWEWEQGSEGGGGTALTKVVKYWIFWGSSHIQPLYFYLEFDISVLPDISTRILLGQVFFLRTFVESTNSDLNSSFPKI